MIDFETAFGPHGLGALPDFRDAASWAKHRAFGKALLGLPLTGDELAVFRTCTGLDAPRVGGWTLGLLSTGRRAGKTRFAVSLACLSAVLPGRGDVTFISQDARQADLVAFQYAREAFTTPALQAEVARVTTDTIELKDGTRVMFLPCRPEACRGLGLRFFVADELAHVRGGDFRPLDRLLIEALTPGLIGTGGRGLITSTPWVAAGEFHRIFTANYGNPDGTVLVWKAPSTYMRPGIEADPVLQTITDVDSRRSEVEAEFRSGVGMLHDPEVVDECIRATGTNPPAPDVRYLGAFDQSGGRNDAACLAVGHRNGSQLVVDLVQRFPAPHSPDAVIERAAAVLREYRIRRVTIDGFGAGFPVRAFAKCGVTAEVSKLDTSGCHLAAEPLIRSGRVELPQDGTLRRELLGLVVRDLPGGRSRADHMPGAHDDVAAAVARLLARLDSVSGSGRAPIAIGGPDRPAVDPDTDVEAPRGYRMLAPGVFVEEDSDLTLEE